MYSSTKSATQILFLRKLIRTSQNFSGTRIFSKFGIGVTKYEVCSNLKDSKIFNNLRMVKRGTCKQITYSVKAKQLKQNDVKIQKTDHIYTQIEQFLDNAILVSGGTASHKQKFIIYNQKEADEYTMQFGRQWHKTKFDRKKQIYIISGLETQQGLNIDRRECEVFDMQYCKFKSIQQITTSVFLFGCDQTSQKVYTFGGYNLVNPPLCDYIQVYDQKLDD